MINKLHTVISENTNPYENIALEEYLLNIVEPGECILYLWQNRRTVVIGRNQNPWKECNYEALKADGGFLARRLSGGGGVFHDLGNLNFTFITRSEDYDTQKQTEVVLRAVNKYGINAVRTGRNDIEVDGKKFSGNAFYKTDTGCYHHGTILINVDNAEMAKYLNPPAEKLKSKGVDSVRSRVTNLIEYAPDMTIEGMMAALTEAFGEVYGAKAELLDPLRLPAEGKTFGEGKSSADKPTSPQANFLGRKDYIISERTGFFGSWEWIFGRKIPFNFSEEKHFDWGNAELQFYVSEGIIKDAKIYSDDLAGSNFDEVCDELIGRPFEAGTACYVWSEIEKRREASWKNTI